MRSLARAALLAPLLALAAAGAAGAQSCLSYSDGLGNTTLTCPDGRTGYIHTDPGGVASGMVGTQPFQAPAGVLAMPLGDPSAGLPTSGAPTAAYVDIPPPPAPPVAAPPPPPTTSAIGSPPLTPAPELTPLQSQYLQERAAEALRRRRAALKAGTFDGRTETPTTAKAKPPATR
jgi:hypothetical protein